MTNERPRWPFRPAPNGRRPPKTGGQLTLLQRYHLGYIDKRILRKETISSRKIIFLRDPLQVPCRVKSYLCKLLTFEDYKCLSLFTNHQPTNQPGK